MSYWSDWIEHAPGSGCPAVLRVGMVMQAVTRDRYGNDKELGGKVHSGILTCPVWEMRDEFGSFELCLRYRYRKPSGLVLLERIAANPREMEDA